MKRTPVDPEERIGKENANMLKRQTSEFYELIPRVKLDNGNNIMKRFATKNAKQLLKQFYGAIYLQFLDSIPFSAFSCILGLPEKISDWPTLECFCEILSILLSDCGFLFEETRPVSERQYMPQYLAAGLDKKNHELDMLYGAESSLISEIQQIFWPKYRCPDEPPDNLPVILKQLEEIVNSQEPGWF